ncbi:MAG: hypothetical protein L0K86_12205, partial [Actinomycetia bacterium]|nr:hypothetical protein [Actinomycetes bacterium]
AGNRAVYSEIDRSCAEQRTTSTDPGAAAEANTDLDFGSEVGALGEAVSCTSVYGPMARLAVSNGSTAADVRPKGDPFAVDPTTWTDQAQSCPLTLIAMPALGHGKRRAEQVAEVDRLIGGLVDALGDSTATRVLLVGVSDTPGIAPTMHVALSLGTDTTAPGILRSASTGRTAYVQLIDVAPTVLETLGIDIPSSMAGRPWQADDETESASDRVAAFQDATEHADAHRTITTPTYWVWDALLAGFLLVAVLLLARGRRPSWLRVAAIAVGAAPLGTFLANLVPWWRADPAWLAYAAATAVATALVAAAACLGAWRRLRFGAPVAVAALTVTTLTLDVLTGSSLQFGSALGYNPIVAGRFTGFGNMPFAVYAVAGLIVLVTLTAGRDRRFILGAGAVGGLTLVVINGAPGVGADFGGVVALVPAVVLLTAVAAGYRLTWLGAVAALVAGAIAVSVVAVLDYLRPVAAQTHLGRFVGQVLDGTAWRIVDRKLDANLHLLTHSPVAVLVPILLVMCWWMLRSADAPGRVLMRSHTPTMTAAYVGVATVALVGTAINDSGIAVLVAAGAVAVPLWVGALDKVPE